MKYIDPEQIRYINNDQNDPKKNLPIRTLLAAGG